jgi:hypothetical protein
MAGVRHYSSIITLNINKLNSPIRRYKFPEWIKKKNKTQLYIAYRKLTSALRTHMD